LKGRTIEVGLEEAGKNKQHGFATKKSIIKVVLCTLTTILEFERMLHLQRSNFPFFDKLSSGCEQENRTSAQNWHKAAETPSFPSCAGSVDYLQTQSQVVGCLELS